MAAAAGAPQSPSGVVAYFSSSSDDYNDDEDLDEDEDDAFNDGVVIGREVGRRWECGRVSDASDDDTRGWAP